MARRIEGDGFLFPFAVVRDYRVLRGRAGLALGDAKIACRRRNTTLLGAFPRLISEIRRLFSYRAARLNKSQ